MTKLLLKLLKIIQQKIFDISSEQNINSLIVYDELNLEKPSMIARFGAVEIKALLYPYMPSLLKVILRKKIFSSMYNNAGFFPATEKTIIEFSDLMFQDIKELDVLGSWRVEELFLFRKLRHKKFVHLKNLEPYFSVYPWTAALKNKNVLVVHPFDKTIENQYNNREKLFESNNILPELNQLITYKPAQTIAGNTDGYKTWFDALNKMKSDIDKIEFDVAILGCGAYGFPLAAHIKRMGKKAVHLGGATQILFGIKGQRWLNNDDFKTIINAHFVFPNENDKPENYKNVEEGCYW